MRSRWLCAKGSERNHSPTALFSTDFASRSEVPRVYAIRRLGVLALGALSMPETFPCNQRDLEPKGDTQSHPCLQVVELWVHQGCLQIVCNPYSAKCVFLEFGMSRQKLYRVCTVHSRLAFTSTNLQPLCILIASTKPHTTRSVKRFRLHGSQICTVDVVAGMQLNTQPRDIRCVPNSCRSASRTRI